MLQVMSSMYTWREAHALLFQSIFVPGTRAEIELKKRPARGPAADQGICPTILLLLLLVVTAVVPATAQTLAANPYTVTFVYRSQQPLPTAVSVAITADTVNPKSIDPQLVSDPVGVFQISSADSTLYVGLDPRVLADLARLPRGGPYVGIVVVTAPGYYPALVQLTLVVNGDAALGVAPAALSFSSASNGSPLPQTLWLSGSGDQSFNFTASATTQAGGNWLSAGPAVGTTPATASVFVNPAGLSPGIYKGSVTIAYGGGQVSVPVDFTVTPGGGPVAVNPTTFFFQYTNGGPLPGVQAASVVGNPAYFYSAVASSDGGWLLVDNSPYSSGMIPAFINLSVNPLGVAPGTHNGTVTLTATDGSSQTITVSLRVNGGALSVAAPAALSFAAPAGAGTPPPSQKIAVAGPAGSPYTVAASMADGQGWLSVSPSSGVAPAVVAVAVNPAGLRPGTYKGAIAATSLNGMQSVPVTLEVSSSPVVLASPGAIVFQAAGAAVFSQDLYVSSSGANLPFAISSSDPWLSAGTVAGTTPAVISVQARPGGLPSGAQAAAVLITPQGAASPAIRIPVIALVGAGASGNALTFSRGSLTFQARQGDPAPAVQSLQVSGGAPGTMFTASARPGSWVSVNPVAGLTPAAATVSVNVAGLAAGTYEDNITLTAAGGLPQDVPVLLNVVDPSGVVLDARPLAFGCRRGASPPPAQTLALSTVGVAAPGYSAGAASSGWLSVTPGSGTAPASLQVFVNSCDLPPGSYTGAVTVVANGPKTTTQSVPVALQVADALPTVSAVLNGATLLSAAIAPGEVITIRGIGIGPELPVSAPLDSGAGPGDSLAGTKVYFNGYPAPVFFTRFDQVGAIVPYAMDGRSTTFVQVEYKGQRSNAFSLAIADSSPGIFGARSGSAQAAAATVSAPAALILNQNSTPNSPDNAADRGSVVTFFATGEGQTDPGGADGRINGVTGLPTPLLPVSVSIDGQAAELVYAGGAPGMVSGILQVNVRVPATVSAGSLPLVLTIGDCSSPAGTRIAVR